ncbi:2860_t:CDS:2 [Entrophospora sp. SA101]|nr:2860_t:CDS:2 [Entrophospora sp. SA101]
MQARSKNSVFFVQHHSEEQIRLAIQKRKDQAWRRLATKNKVAQTAGYNLPTHKEKRSIEELLKKHGKFAYLTSKPLGRYYLSTLDLDLRKVEFPEKFGVECQ